MSWQCDIVPAGRVWRPQMERTDREYWAGVSQQRWTRTSNHAVFAQRSGVQTQRSGAHTVVHSQPSHVRAISMLQAHRDVRKGGLEPLATVLDDETMQNFWHLPHPTATGNHAVGQLLGQSKGILAWCDTLCQKRCAGSRLLAQLLSHIARCRPPQ